MCQKDLWTCSWLAKGVDILHPKTGTTQKNPGFSDIVAWKNIPKMVLPSWELTVLPSPLKRREFQGTVFGGIPMSVQGTNFWLACHDPKKPPMIGNDVPKNSPCSQEQWKSPTNPKISSRDFDFTISTPVGFFINHINLTFTLPQNPRFFPPPEVGPSWKILTFHPLDNSVWPNRHRQWMTTTRSARCAANGGQPSMDSRRFFFHFNESRFTEPKTVRNDKLRSLNDARSNYM